MPKNKPAPIKPKLKTLEDIIQAAAEKEEPKTFQPYTHIRCIKGNMWDERLIINKVYLFMGWITNPSYSGNNCILMDDRGVFETDIKEEEFKVLK